VYGGLLCALAPSAPLDPFHTRTKGGGLARNFLGAKPDGPLLGVELDVGASWSWELPQKGALLQLQLEHGLLLPGGALGGADGAMPMIQSTRLSLALLEP